MNIHQQPMLNMIFNQPPSDNEDEIIIEDSWVDHQHAHNDLNTNKEFEDYDKIIGKSI